MQMRTDDDIHSILYKSAAVKGGGSCTQFTAIKDGKSRIKIITIRVSQIAESNIVNEEQRRLHIDSFYSLQSFDKLVVI